ncbi:DNA polymerase delta catalytic subunit-like [Malus sylvestris]|uniref:DNA polymerase delta catalytic subunit-like n=1 Tax=Malus sylvestris TaxID=3752 RepID=UPI0021ABBBA5|nr:DNA polymerase delta catalytic subunit-like [Malus sylvestris]
MGFDIHSLEIQVLEAKAGFYEKPIATLDFASLYPSIMMAYAIALCEKLWPKWYPFFYVKVKPEVVHKLNIPPECVNKTPSGETFVKSNLQKGTHPEILEELLAARKRAKADLKISANSVYGFTGATVPITMFRDIIKCRQMIEHTKNIVKDKFTTLKGYEHNAEVIYGDTDSVMVQFGVPTVEAAMNLGREAAEYISGTFITPIKLEFEKVYYPYLLISKKRYAGLLWTNPGKFDKMDTKGLTKTGDDYGVKAAHVELAERMRKRDAATAPNVGDRVPYVIIKAAKGAKRTANLRSFEHAWEGQWTSKADRTLCSHCKGREAELYCKTVAHVSELEMLFGRLWMQCQECQGSLHQDVLCTSRDCPIFYRRRKAQKDMAEAKVQLDRWSF